MTTDNTDLTVTESPVAPPKDYTGLNRVLKAMRATDKEDGDFNKGMVLVDEKGDSFIADVHDVHEAVGFLFNPTQTLNPLMVAVHLWTLFKGGDIPLPPTAKIHELHVTLLGDQFVFEALFNSDEGDHHLEFSVCGMDIAQRMDITRRLSLISAQLAPMRGSWAIDYRFSLGEGSIDFMPLKDDDADEQPA